MSLFFFVLGAVNCLAIDGLGTQANPYKISSLADFDRFADPNLAAIYWADGVYTQLENDLNLIGRTSTHALIAPDISSDTDFQGNPYSGSFDGKDHTIYNLTIEVAGDLIEDANDYLGLFGKIDGATAEIKNLTLDSATVTGGHYSQNIGMLCGYNQSGTISYCQATGNVNGGYSAGICGYNHSGTISNCSADVTITDGKMSGGICGSNFYGVIDHCTAIAHVSGELYSWYLSGLCAWNAFSTISNSSAAATIVGGDDAHYMSGLCSYNHLSTIENCYVTGSVTGGSTGDYLGGLCSRNVSGTIANCYSTASVAGKGYSKFIGGFCGVVDTGTISNCYATGEVSYWPETKLYGSFCSKNYNGSINNCYWNKETSGLPYSSGGWARTSAQMKQEATYISWDNAQWIIDEGQDYPHLAWEGTAGSVIDYTQPRTYNGDGVTQPYEITDANDLVCMTRLAQDWDKKFVLTSDIDMAGVMNYQPVTDFNGVFDGAGFTVSNLTIDVAQIGSNTMLGLIGKANSAAELKNFTMDNVVINGGKYALYLGGIAGYCQGRIEHCHGSVNIIGSWYSEAIGGLCGRISMGTIINSSSSGSVFCGDNVSLSSSSDVGGLCGTSYGTISSCFSNAQVTGGRDSQNVGGLCGSANYILNCYATGNASGYYHIGGLCGEGIGESIFDSITNCYSTGMALQQSDYYDALCGDYDGTITSSYYLDTDKLNWFYSGGTPLADAQMRIQTSYIDWDFSDTDGNPEIWQMPFNEYPRLAWEGVVITSPNIVSMTQAHAESAITSAGLTIGVVTQGYSLSIPAGMIISQSPPGLTNVLIGCPIDLVVSLGPAVSGQGDPNNPYRITSTDAYLEFSNPAYSAIYWAAGVYAQLDTNLDLNGIAVNRIGPDDLNSYHGIFNGNNHQISNLTIDILSDYVGMFGYITQDAAIQKLNLVNVSIKGGDYTGGLCGRNDGGSISNCSVSGSVTGYASNNYQGGLCGFNAGGNIRNCFADMNLVEGYNKAGGLVGENRRWKDTTGNWRSGNIIKCHSAGVVSGNSIVGGLVGNNTANIRMSYSQAAVNGNNIVGGLVGASQWAASGDDNVVAPGTVIYCHASGSVTGINNDIGGLVGQNSGNLRLSYATGAAAGDSDVGGLVGWDQTDRISDCYARGDVTGRDDVGGLIGRSGISFGNGDGCGGVNRCCSTGKVSATSDGGGLIGLRVYGDINDSFWDTQTSNQPTSAGGTGKTTAEMKNADTFTDAGWNFEKPIWFMPEPNYPQLIVWGEPDSDDNGKIDLHDYANLSRQWLNQNCGICAGADLTGDSLIDTLDLNAFTNRWLTLDDVTDHVYAVEIVQGRDWEIPGDNSDDEYIFELRIVTDHKVERIEFLTPAGNTFELPNTPYRENILPYGVIESGWDYEIDPPQSGSGDYQWFYNGCFDDAGCLADYGDGQYTLTFHYDNQRQHQTSFWFGVPGTADYIDPLIQEPNITSFAQEQHLPSPVTFSWNPCTETHANLIFLCIENTDSDDEQEFMLPPTATGLDNPLTLIPGPCEINLAFAAFHQSQNPDGIELTIIKFTESDYSITVIPPE